MTSRALGVARSAGRAGPALRAPLAAGLLVCALGAPATAQPPDGGLPVELELVLAVDISASIDDVEFRLQMAGIAAAFRDPGVIAAIEALGPLGIAVTLVQWSKEPRQTLPWRRVWDGASAELVALRVEASRRLAVGHTTAIGSALDLAGGLFAGNGFAGKRRSIDVSGDGRNNDGLPIWAARSRALASGLTINGLAILDGDPKLKGYYETWVAGGPNAFVVAADDFADFARAFRDKLLGEIQPAVARRDLPRRHDQGMRAATR